MSEEKLRWRVSGGAVEMLKIGKHYLDNHTPAQAMQVALETYQAVNGEGDVLVQQAEENTSLVGGGLRIRLERIR